MKKITKFLSWAIPITIVFSMALPISAQIIEPGLSTADELFVLIDDIMAFVMLVIIIIGVFVLLIGAIHFLTAGGDPERTKKAQSLILYGVIGIIIGLFAKGLVWVIANIVGVDVGNIYW